MLRFYLSTLLLSVSLLSQAQSVLWEISGNGLKKSSYLFGTVHIQDKRVFGFDDLLYKKLKSCKTYAMEITPDADNLASIAKGMMLPEGKTLKDIYSPEDYQLIADTLKKYTGMPIVLFNTMQPIVLSSMLTDAQLKKDMDAALDIHLYNYAKEHKLNTASIETVDEQIAAMGSISSGYVLETFKNVQAGDTTLNKILEHYCAARLDSLHHYLTEEDEEGFETEELLDNRNVRMADRIGEMAQEKPVFAAVGAGHLWGDKGVIALLREKGYQVEPVELPFKTGN